MSKSFFFFPACSTSWPLLFFPSPLPLPLPPPVSCLDRQAVDRAFRSARELAPSIVFIDEFQALFAARDAGGGTG